MIIRQYLKAIRSGKAKLHKDIGKSYALQLDDELYCDVYIPVDSRRGEIYVRTSG